MNELGYDPFKGIDGTAAAQNPLQIKNRLGDSYDIWVCSSNLG